MVSTHPLGLRGWDRDATPAGMPYPQNLETAKEVEEVVRAAGAEPATIAVLDGVPHIGLTAAELQHLASLGHSVVRISSVMVSLTSYPSLLWAYRVGNPVALVLTAKP